MHINGKPVNMKKRHVKYLNFAEGSYFLGACLERSNFHPVQRLLSLCLVSVLSSALQFLESSFYHGRCHGKSLPLLIMIQNNWKRESTPDKMPV